jgi:methylated-DNA-[protein]-cysteine S-methyltransferase
MPLYYTYTPSPLGDLLLAGQGETLSFIGFPEGKARMRHQDIWLPDDLAFRAARQQLRAYFAGELMQFDLPLAPVGTPFQQLVWQALQSIPYGQTRSYGEIAAQIGRPRASRAVGAANGRNPLPIVIPCHRVIGATGNLTGFGGGLEAKARLLRLEQFHAPFRLEA